jgi:AraC family transcriptional regulator
MTFNVQKVDIGTVPINLPRGSDRKLSVRGLSKSRLIASEIRYGLTPFSGKPNFPLWSDAYSIGVALREHKSDIVVDGKRFSHSRRTSEIQVLYVSGVEHVDFITTRHGVEILLPRSFMREIADDLEVPHVTHLGRSLCHIAEDPALRRLALQIHPFFDAPDTLEPLQADHFMWTFGIYVCANYGDLAARRLSTGGLTTWQERLAKDVIEARIVGGIGLTELGSEQANSRMPSSVLPASHPINGLFGDVWRERESCWTTDAHASRRLRSPAALRIKAISPELLLAILA